MEKVKERTESEITKDHDQALLFVGKKVYQFFLPIIEINESLHHVLSLNREMYALKAKEKEEKK